MSKGGFSKNHFNGDQPYLPYLPLRQLCDIWTKKWKQTFYNLENASIKPVWHLWSRFAISDLRKTGAKVSKNVSIECSFSSRSDGTHTNMTSEFRIHEKTTKMSLWECSCKKFSHCVASWHSCFTDIYKEEFKSIYLDFARFLRGQTCLFFIHNNAYLQWLEWLMLDNELPCCALVTIAIFPSCITNLVILCPPVPFWRGAPGARSQSLPQLRSMTHHDQASRPKSHALLGEGPGTWKSAFVSQSCYLQIQDVWNFGLRNLKRITQLG